MAINYQKDEQNIVTLTLDMPNRSANVINAEFGAAFQAALERLAAEEELAGVIITSGKKIFMAGADLEDPDLFADAQKVFDMGEALKAGFRRLETL
ncbi:MAG TPA: 3-hydroxyacyl-CoA dehydrogenase, partial [Anaerolineae bacterium]|nr:3-hydroxyacyl-CoA dehydrogenase [Anaerolineae bacterium]